MIRNVEGSTASSGPLSYTTIEESVTITGDSEGGRGVIGAADVADMDMKGPEGTISALRERA